MAAREPVKEALDHLLDPLDLPGASREPAEDEAAVDWPMPAAHIDTPRGPRQVVAGFLVRVRRSRRLLYKIPRLLVAWTLLILGVSGLIWITFSAVGLR